MEQLRRLLGTLQQALDYVSSFTTYLIGDETYPGAEATGGTRERNSSGHQSGEVESTCYRSNSSRGHLEVLKAPDIAEINPGRKQVPVASEAADDSTHAADVILKSSKLPDRSDGWEEHEQNLSGSSRFPDASQTKPTASEICGTLQKEELRLIEGLHQREPEGLGTERTTQQEGVVDTGCDLHLKPGRSGYWEPSDESPKGQDKKEQIVWNEDIQQDAGDEVCFAEEQQRELKRVKYTEGSQLEGLEEPRLIEGLHRREPEGLSWKGTTQQDGMVDTACDLHSELGRSDRGPGGTVESTEGQEKKEQIVWNEDIQQDAGDEVYFAEEQQRELKRVKYTEGSQLEGLEEPRLIEGLHRREPEGLSWKGTTQQDGMADTACDLHSETGRSDRGPGDILENPQGQGKKEQIVWNEDIQQDAGDEVCFAEEQQGELKTVKYFEGSQTGGFDEPRLIEGLHQMEPEGLSWKGTTQQDGMLDTGYDLHSEPGRSGDREPGCAVESPEGQEKKIVWTEDIQHDTGDGVCFAEGSQPEGLEEPRLIEGVHQREPEEINWKGTTQQERVADTGCDLHWELGRPGDREPGSTIDSPESAEKKEEIVWNKDIQPQAEVRVCFAEQQRELERVKYTTGCQPGDMEEEVELVNHHKAKTEKKQQDEIRKQGGLLDMVGAEGLLKGKPHSTESQEDQDKTPEGAGKKHQWDLKWEFEGTERDQESQEEEMISTNERLPEGDSAFAVLSGRIQSKVEEDDKMREDQQLEEEEEEEEEAMSDMVGVVGEREEIQHALSGKGEPEGEQEEPLKGTKNSHQCELLEIVTLEQQSGDSKGVAQIRKGLQDDLEVDQEEEQEEPMENREEQRKQTEKLESAQEGESKILAEQNYLDEEELVEVNATGIELRQSEETEGNLQEPDASFSTGLLVGTRAFPDQVTPLDTSAQKERVLLRRKSSIRRAPSLKKSKTPVENQPQETNTEEDIPRQPQIPTRPKPRHSGFGPMHPTMMAELQMRLRKPQ